MQHPAGADQRVPGGLELLPPARVGQVPQPVPQQLLGAPSGGNSEYLIGRKSGDVASVSAGRIIVMRTRTDARSGRAVLGGRFVEIRRGAGGGVGQGTRRDMLLFAAVRP